MNVHEDRPAGTASGLNIGTGTFFRLLLAPALAAGFLLGSNAADAAQAVVSGEFVGAIPNADPKDPPGGSADELVAVIVNDAAPPTSRRGIRVYICDGDTSAQNDAEWFKGFITGDTFRLTSADGDATAQGVLTETAATGTISLPDGRTLSFRAVPARAGGGFYEVFLLANGTKGGVSPSGNTHSSRVISEWVQGNLAIKTLQDTIRTLEGQTFTYRARLTGIGPPKTHGLVIIILNNAADAAGRGSDIKSGSTGFSWVHEPV